MATVETGGMPVIMGNGGNDAFGMGGGGFIWAFLIFALLMGNGGFGFGGGAANALGYENLATSNEVQRGFDNQNSMANEREILSAVTNGTAQSVATSNQVYHDLVNVVQDKYGELQRDMAGLAVGQANLLAKQNECCCSQLRAIDGVNYNNAMNTAAINANTTAQTQKILDALAQNKIEALQGKVNQLELAQAVSGVVRYPNSMAYSAGTSPFCNCGNGGYPVYPVYA